MTSTDHVPVYSPKQIQWIQSVYLVGLIFWIILIIGLGLFPTNNVIEFLIVLIPIILFMISMVSVPYISDTVEKYIFQANALTLGIIIAFPILTWVYKRSIHNRSIFLSIIATAIIFSVLSLFDISVPHKILPVVKHLKSVLQTFALTLFIFAVYRYIAERKDRDIQNGKIQDL